MKRIIVAGMLLLSLITVTGCGGGANKRQAGSTEKISIPSMLLGKSITSYVYLPYGYDSAEFYPTLYYMASGGGSAGTVVNQFDITGAADELIRNGEIEPMIIVALGIEFSFGINSSDTTGESVFESEAVYTFKEGPYEDYIIREAIPYIDAHYATRAQKEFRYIGGYSMGGFAALHVGFRNPELFSKIGGHSPTLFLDIYVTPEIDHWLFPTKDIRLERDPMYLADTANLERIEIYLDTGPADVNAEACIALAQKLRERGVDVTFSALFGSHGLLYCCEHMPEYLRFYGSIPNVPPQN